MCNNGLSKNQERDQERIEAQRVDIPVPPVMEESVTVQQIKNELQERITKQRVNTPVPLDKKKITEVIQLIALECPRI